jgi:hypothetical protein
MLLSSKVMIHQRNTREISLRTEFIGTDYFDHPIEHSRPQLLVNIVLGEESDLG